MNVLLCVSIVLGRLTGGAEVKPHLFQTLAIHRTNWSALTSRNFIPSERNSDTQWVRGWMDSRVGLDMVVRNPSPAADLTRLAWPLVSYYQLNCYCSDIFMRSCHNRW
jgi:hypothetical protein